jgi:hypothetical protein
MQGRSSRQPRGKSIAVAIENEPFSARKNVILVFTAF